MIDSFYPYLSICSYGIHSHLNITCRVPCMLQTLRIKNKADSENVIKIHSISMLYRRKKKAWIKPVAVNLLFEVALLTPCARGAERNGIQQAG